MWYTPKEHGSRHSVRFAGNFIAALIGAMIAYGVLHYDDGFSQWRVSLSSLALGGPNTQVTLCYIRSHYHCLVRHPVVQSSELTIQCALPYRK